MLCLQSDMMSFEALDECVRPFCDQPVLVKTAQDMMPGLGAMAHQVLENPWVELFRQNTTLAKYIYGLTWSWCFPPSREQWINHIIPFVAPVSTILEVGAGRGLWGELYTRLVHELRLSQTVKAEQFSTLSSCEDTIKNISTDPLDDGCIGTSETLFRKPPPWILTDLYYTTCSAQACLVPSARGDSNSDSVPNYQDGQLPETIYTCNNVGGILSPSAVGPMSMENQLQLNAAINHPSMSSLRSTSVIKMSSIDAITHFSKTVVSTPQQLSAYESRHGDMPDAEQDMCLVLLSPDFDLTDTVATFSGSRLILAPNTATRDTTVVENHGFVLSQQFCIHGFTDRFGLGNTAAESTNNQSLNESENNDMTMKEQNYADDFDQCCHQKVFLYVRQADRK